MPTHFQTLRLVFALASFLGWSLPGWAQTDTIVRTRQPLSTGWEFRQEGQLEWKTVDLPSTFESHEGIEFDGIGWYRRTLQPMELGPNERVAVRFEGAATQASVWCAGEKVGSHLGGWTPFSCDITNFVRAKEAAEGEQTPVELLVRLDELVGHNSQGFLPVFAPHFGGLWKDVSLEIYPSVRIDADRLFAWGDLEKRSLEIEVPIVAPSGTEAKDAPRLHSIAVQYRVRARAGEPAEAWTASAVVPWTSQHASELAEHEQVHVPMSIAIDAPRAWSPDDPTLYEVVVTLHTQSDPSSEGSGILSDRVETTAGFRSIEARGDELLLNGRPLQVRGILNWGYAPPSTAPSLDPEFWARELDLVRENGFNLMKFCLWVPPKEYLRMADERGILVWMEYPTWHSKWTADQLPTLEREFDEFFAYDRPHPSVILRSLTCETGPSADLEVIRALYDRCHKIIPGCIVEDDSSWIQWNRVHDFYDDHPYGNNDTWVDTLSRLKSHIAAGKIKPLVLGEAIAADTWVVPEQLDDALGRSKDEPLPFWLPGFFEANRHWSHDRRLDMGATAVERLQSDSLDYAIRMRKYQIEAYRREVPHGGYVVSVVRDFPLAGMGLMDYLGQSKWSPQSHAWDWHGEDMLLLQIEGDRRSFVRDEPIHVEFLSSHYSNERWDSATLQVTLTCVDDGRSATVGGTATVTLPLAKAAHDAFGRAVQVTELGALEWELGPSTGDRVANPEEWLLRAWVTDSEDNMLAQNSWSLWAFPDLKIPAGDIELHPSCHDRVRTSLTQRMTGDAKPHAEAVEQPAIVCQRLDEALLDRLESGANVLMIPDGQTHSLPLQSHWFLRGGPIVSSRGGWNDLHPMLVQLQHFDLASQVVPDIAWLEELTPLLMLWDNHDIRRVKTHGLVFASRVGRGTLLVSALDLDDRSGSVASSYMIARLLASLTKPDGESSLLAGMNVTDMKLATRERMREQLRMRTILLTDREWRFRPDPQNEGLDRGWQGRNWSHHDWDTIRIGSHWESQGYADLDGWAWYAIDVELPEDWVGDTAYLWMDGADDYCEVYVNDELVGTAGDLVKRQTAFEERSSFRVPLDRSKRIYRVAIRVQDWVGSGGLFRPIAWCNAPRSDLPPILR